MGDAMSAAAVYLPQAPSGDETRRRLAGKRPDEIAKEFEAILLAQVISAMRKTVPDSGVLEASASRRMLDGAFDQEVARSLATRGGLGIASQLVGEIRSRAGEAGAPARTGSTSGSSIRPAAVAGARTHVAVHPEPRSAAPSSATGVPPVAGDVTSSFGVRRDPFTGEERFHAGVDVAAPRGTAIRAVADGEVVWSGWREGGGGRVVEVRHADGLVTSYAHAERTLVRVGQRVVAGEVVATVGSSGRASGPHLHFAAARHGQPIDPSGFLESGRPVASAQRAGDGST